MPYPTPYPDVNSILQQLLDGVREILEDEFIGLYLYGSLALGDFDPVKSDIDFLVVTRRELEPAEVDALKTMHARLAATGSKWAVELEGSYIPQDSLRRYNPADTHHAHIDREGDGLAIKQHDTDWIIQRYVLRENGVTVAGPDPKTLIDPISQDELRQAVLDLLWWWEMQLNDTKLIEQSNYQSYTVLSQCRILYTMQYGEIVSKPAAARWAVQSLDSKWSDLIERALSWQPGEEMGSLEETLEFFRYTLIQCGHTFK